MIHQAAFGSAGWSACHRWMKAAAVELSPQAMARFLSRAASRSRPRCSAALARAFRSPELAWRSAAFQKAPGGMAPLRALRPCCSR